VVGAASFFMPIPFFSPKYFFLSEKKSNFAFKFSLINTMQENNQPLLPSDNNDKENSTKSEQPIYQAEWDMTPPPPTINPRDERKEKYLRWSKNLWRVAGGTLAALVLYIIFLNFSKLPTFEELENPKSNLASEIFGSNNEVIGRYYIENRVAVPYDSLSPFLIDALISTEDERYYSHSGIDWEAFGRVAKGLVTFNPQGGGSTITQQLAKLLYSDRDFRGMGTVRRTFSLVNTKLKEWITAVKLEKSYTKKEIIAMYFNQADFIYGGTGIRSASEIYFGKPQNKLKLEEAAVLVGMLQNPALHNPVRHPQRSLNRRNIVLSQMVRNKRLTEQDFERLKKLPIKLNFTKNAYNSGIAAYFRMELRKDIQTILDNPALRKADGSKYNIYKDGLKIYTSIDPVMQRHAEAAANEHMAQLQKKYFTVWKGRDPWSDKAINIDAKLRNESLQRIIYGSDRYQTIRSKYLDDVVSEIQNNVEGLVLNDDDIDILMNLDKNGGVLAKLVTEKNIPAEKVAQFRRLLENKESWGSLKKQWLALQSAVQKDFNTKVPMKIFAHSLAGEKDTVMSPIDSIKYHRMFLQIGSLSVDPKTGYVKAWVGGINHKYFQFDHCRNFRQVGSTIKPYVYATAVAQQGVSPCMQIPDLAYTISPGDGNFGLARSWTPSNAKGYSGRALNLKEALKESVNSISVFLLKQLGDTGPVRGLMNNMGIDSARIMRQPALCLGACDLSVMDMAGAYTTFANDGIFNRPMYLLRIEDKNGKVIYSNLPEEHRALGAGANYVMVDMLKYVVSGAPGIKDLKSEVGGKTGTTNDYVDGWFMGVTPTLVVGTWVGGDDRWIRFLTIADGQGGAMARPFFAKFLKKIETDPKSGYDYNKKFKVPPGDLGITINCNDYNKGNAAPTEEFSENEFEQ
jgi:penicillin-binding protein 1A